MRIETASELHNRKMTEHAARVLASQAARDVAHVEALTEDSQREWNAWADGGFDDERQTRGANDTLSTAIRAIDEDIVFEVIPEKLRVEARALQARMEWFVRQLDAL